MAYLSGYQWLFCWRGVEFTRDYVRPFRKFFKGKHFDEPVNAIGKIAVVTGSSSGIGRCIAEELNRRGAKVYMLCRNREKSEKVIAELVEVSGLKCFERKSLGLILRC